MSYTASELAGFWWYAAESAVEQLCQFVVFVGAAAIVDANTTLVASAQVIADFRSVQRSLVHKSSGHDDCPCDADFCGDLGEMSSLIPGSDASAAKPAELFVA